MGVNESIIIFSSFVIRVFTQAILGMGALIASITIVRPLIIKIITIPVFWLLNAMSTLISAVAIKKGYATHLTKGRILTVVLLIGIIIGYIIDNFIPLV